MRRRIAFSLVEVIVVMAIIGLVVAMSVPGLGRYAKQMRMKAATRQVMSLILLARSTAITSHADQAVAFDGEQGVARIVDPATGEAQEQVVRLPGGVTASVEIGGEPVEPPHLIFRPTGALTGRSASVVLTEGTRRRTITVTGATGSVSLEQE